MDIRKLQRAIVDGLEDVKAQNIVVFNTEHLSPLFERVIIASGTSNRQTRSLATSVREAVKEAGLPVPRMEGESNGEWIIVDCGQAVVHVMQPPIREYYHLEELWGEKPVKLKLGSATPRLVKASEGGDDDDEAVPAKKTSRRRAASSEAGEAAGGEAAPPAKRASSSRSTPAKRAALDGPTPKRAVSAESADASPAPAKRASTRRSAAADAPAKKAPARKTMPASSRGTVTRVTGVKGATAKKASRSAAGEGSGATRKRATGAGSAARKTSRSA
ncbi:ribosome silencing factor [Piscinibacter koreensis]|uniref:Ribosomal silencing factor RsfS n=1 Tax=Piscinibacter koreensis TaxID=2742824 RepID=A0A7Y6NLJ9_9BURK|nr:ribosome silencing factor [Schlegelella koreensis]NUZ05317.1 ribosome silencing factor [Schlegelella koreensis]